MLQRLLEFLKRKVLLITHLFRVYGIHKTGFAFSMRLTIQERRKESGERQFIGLIAESNQNTTNAVVIISEMGYIRLVTRRTLEMFGGYEAGDLLGKVVFLIFLTF